MNIVAIILAVLCGVVSVDDLRQRGQEKDAHTVALAAQAEAAQVHEAMTSLLAAEAKQRAAQAAEDAARSTQGTARVRQGQIQQTYSLAVGRLLVKDPPDVAGAIQLNALAVQAGDAPTAETAQAAQALADAKAAAQAALIEELQKELAEVKQTVAVQAVEIKQAHAANLDAVQQIGTLTGTVATHAAKEGDLVAKVATVTA